MRESFLITLMYGEYMIPILDDDNKHLLLKKYDLGSNSFITNVNKLAKNLDDIQAINDKFDEDTVETLYSVTTENGGSFNISAITEDLNKNTYRGNRKLDIDVMKNFKNYDDDLTEAEKLALCNDPVNHVYYYAVKAYFVDVVTDSKYTLTKEVPVATTDAGVTKYKGIWSNAELLAFLDDWTEFKEKYGNAVIMDAISDEVTDHHIVRIIDDPDQVVGTKLTSISLFYVAKENCDYYDNNFVGTRQLNNESHNINDINFAWSDSTSTLSVITDNLTSIITAAQESEYVKQYQKQISEDYDTAIAGITSAKESSVTELNELNNSIKAQYDTALTAIDTQANVQINRIVSALGSAAEMITSNSINSYTWTLTDNVAAEETLTLGSMSYFIGYKQLLIFYNGIHLSPTFYSEVDPDPTNTDPHMGTQITIHTDFTKGSEFTVVIIPFGNTDVQNAINKLSERITSLEAYHNS